MIAHVLLFVEGVLTPSKKHNTILPGNLLLFHWALQSHPPKPAAEEARFLRIFTQKILHGLPSPQSRSWAKRRKRGSSTTLLSLRGAVLQSMKVSTLMVHPYWIETSRNNLKEPTRSGIHQSLDVKILTPKPGREIDRRVLDPQGAGYSDVQPTSEIIGSLNLSIYRYKYKYLYVFI